MIMRLKRLFQAVTIGVVLSTLNGCAHLCGDYGTREGVGPFVFRCNTSQR